MKNYIEERYKTRDEWKLSRGIGGSSAAAVIGESHYKTPLDIFNDLLHPSTEDKKNSRMMEGTLAEEHIRKLWALENPQYKMIAPPKRVFWQFRRIDYPELTLTPDGIIRDKETKKLYGWECKDVELRKRETREMWESDILPTEYYCQCLHYMIVRNDLHGVCLTVRLKYFKYEESLGKQVLECVVTKDIWVFREDVKEDIEKVENSEIKFIVENLRPKKMPKIKIKF